jgi:hypothetical protein
VAQRAGGREVLVFVNIRESGVREKERGAGAERPSSWPGSANSEAPDLFTYDESNHCFVKSQPRTQAEIDRAIRAVWAAELEYIRYRG